MATDDTPHGRLIGLEDAQLLALAPEATHQHRKGGLYRDLGLARFAADKSVITDDRGVKQRAWLHVHPHEVGVLMRGIDEDDKFRAIR